MAVRPAPARTADRQPDAEPAPARAYGPHALAALALLCGAALSLLTAQRPPRLRPVEAPSCPVPVEAPGRGLRCLPGDAPGRYRAGDVLLREAEAGPPARMAPQRLLVAGAPIDLNRASAGELLALPGVGPALAARLQAARPLRDLADLATVVGARRAAELLPLCVTPLTPLAP